MLVLVAALCAGFPAPAGNPVLLVIGDSLSAAYGISRDAGWVALLEERLERHGLAWHVVNASISGDTSRGALARFPDALARHAPAVVVIEIGGNDGLRGLPARELEANLRRMVGLAQAAGARVLLVPVRLPPNYGPVYTERFNAAYREVAASTGASLSAGILDGVADEPAAMQADGIHPVAAAQPRLLDNVWPALEALLAGAARVEAALP